MDFLKLIRIIDENKLIFFSSKEIARMINVEASSIQNYLETLANNELIIRVEKGKYCRTFLRDGRVIGSHLIEGGVVSYETALQYHGLIDSVSRDIYIASDHQKHNKQFLGFNFNFVKVRPHKYFGFSEVSNENGSFRISDPEKTLIDCFDLPKYTSSYSKLVQILSRQRFDGNRLLEYGTRIQNLSVLKRLAFLIEKFELSGYQKFSRAVSQQCNDRYTLLNPGGPNTGPFNAKWRIRDNMY